jgi:hypothetical protein
LIDWVEPKPRAAPCAAALRAGSRKAAPPPRPERPPPTPPIRQERLNPDDIKLLRAPNFLRVCRIKGVVGIRTTLEELKREVDRELKELERPTFAELADLGEQFFCDVMNGDCSAETAKEKLPAEFHDLSTDCKIRRQLGGSRRRTPESFSKSQIRRH